MNPNTRAFKWQRVSRADEYPSPFARGPKERNLRVTLHRKSFDNDRDSAAAIGLLYELCQVDHIDVCEIDGNIFPNISIGTPSPETPWEPIHVTLRKGSETHGSWTPEFPKLKDDISQFARRHRLSDGDATSLILVVQAHEALGRDILITSAPSLLTNQDLFYTRYANILSPRDAIAFVGLYLRSREFFRISKIHNLDHWYFYNRWAWHRLPAIRSIIGKLSGKPKTTHDDPLHEVHAITQRVARAAQALDAIAFEYHKAEESEDGDIAAYHFEYLTLLLAGVFDSLALIARRACKISKPERTCVFQSKEFVAALERCGATALTRLTKSAEFLAYRGLSLSVRNLIHSRTMTPVKYSGKGMYLQLDPGQKDQLLNYANLLGGQTRWGIENPFGTMRPYLYAQSLMDESLRWINSLALEISFEKSDENSALPPKRNSEEDRIDAALDLLMGHTNMELK